MQLTNNQTIEFYTNSNNISNKSSNSNSNNMYSANGIVRIRKPHPHDVLSGRGGGINSHPGNKVFREWVAERKEAYNLAITKVEKAEIAHEVMNLVQDQNPPGRFLQRDASSTPGYNFWVEIDSNRALAKTSQALREGAPQIRAAHKEELGEKIERARRTRRRSRPAVGAPSSEPPLSVPAVPPPAPRLNSAIRELEHNVEQAMTQADSQEAQLVPNTRIVPPLVSNRQFEQIYMRPEKRAKFDSNRTQVPFNSTSNTPPLTSVPTISIQDPAFVVPPMPQPNSVRKSNGNTLVRANSLALSDFSQGDLKDEDLSQDFVNPFDDESDIINGMDPPMQRTSPRPPSRVLRNISSDDKYEQRNSFSGRTFADLSDLGDDEPALLDTDFGEGMKAIFDATHPGLMTPEKGDWALPTLLMPWKGNERRISSRSVSFTKEIEGRQ